MLGFSHIAWALNQVTKGDGKEIFMWGSKQKWAFNDVKHCLFSDPVLSFIDLQQSFDIDTDASNYVVGAVLTHHGHSVAYHSETLSDTIWKYPTYDNKMYSIVQYCCHETLDYGEIDDHTHWSQAYAVHTDIREIAERPPLEVVHLTADVPYQQKV